MIFFFTTIDPIGHLQESFIGEVDLEVGLGLLDHVVAQGHRLLTVTISEAGHLSDLPVEAGEETAYLPAIRRLQSEWQQLLSDPVKVRVLYTQRLLVLRSRRIRRHQVCITHLEGMVDRSEYRFQHVLATIFQEPHRSRTLHQLEATLKRHQQSLVTEQASLERFLC